ncbi:FtsP/CotA-like multicopper oxidase with cupredoxin domain [Litoreibacter halocynthiae]|uniref:FtsP/CotA-like multicopper oxidase with cupredoxin domain n=1 Tax=Litoreibacter halocynthiae TaxID=1242689 RepID=A0A4R7LB66_9RHOB|nr:multicopper oxidase family protein [Litoreibacter halocynthiae]TDT72708.1 FtsP/CotA-like multicopper oxidase with cupredoxin domain [Litoreibacter halocynthiae]
MLRLNRRQFLASAASFATLPVGASLASSDPIDLNAQVADLQLLPNGYGKTSIWGFEGMTPGPEIRLGQGQRVQRRLVNALPDPTSVHWHGIRIDNAMDGVSGLTQAAVPRGETFDYDFIAPDAGTYWYHAHNRSFEQVARGLAGALIVEEADTIDVDREEVLILDDWLLDPDTAQIVSDFAAPHARSHGGRIGNFVTTNGIYNLALNARQNERMRLRIINASNARVFPLRLDGLEGWTVALDGMPLLKPEPVTETIILGPAQRIDLIVDVVASEGEAAHVVHLGQSDAASQVAFEVSSGGAATRRGAPAPLPPNAHQMVDLSKAKAMPLKMEGGAMGGLRSATLDGETKSMAEIVEAGRYWAFNGAADGRDGPAFTKLSQGEHVHLTIANDTAFPHAMHLHGMHFHEVNADGSLGPLRDTTLIERGNSRDIAFVADNPGKWLLHCHMLSHAASGMSTWIDVA